MKIKKPTEEHKSTIAGHMEELIHSYEGKKHVKLVQVTHMMTIDGVVHATAQLTLGDSVITRRYTELDGVLAGPKRLTR